jgi:hypothetical protein
MAKSKYTAHEYERSKDLLSKLLPVGRTVYTLVDKVYGSGRSQCRVFVSHEGEIREITTSVATVINAPIKRGGAYDTLTLSYSGVNRAQDIAERLVYALLPGYRDYTGDTSVVFPYVKL